MNIIIFNCLQYGWKFIWKSFYPKLMWNFCCKQYSTIWQWTVWSILDIGVAATFQSACHPWKCSGWLEEDDLYSPFQYKPVYDSTFTGKFMSCFLYSCLEALIITLLAAFYILLYCILQTFKDRTLQDENAFNPSRQWYYSFLHRWQSQLINS